MVDRSTQPAGNLEIKTEDRRAGTRAFLAQARQMPDATWIDVAHGYVYIRWPYLYISIATGEHWIARAYIGLRERLSPLGKALGRLFPAKESETQGEGSFADGYHGKVMPLESAKQLVMVEEEIELKDLDNIIPFDTARDIVFQNPDHIVVLDCPCRDARAEGCQPLDVCLVIGEPFASFAAEYHPQRSRWIGPQEAADILQAEHDRGHVHHAFFKDAMLGRFYAICNCCSCCCGAMQANRHGTPMSISSGYVCQLDEESCIGCGMCEEICPFGAIASPNGEQQIDSLICMGCGVCVSACDQDALTLVRDPTKSEPLIITELIRQAAAR
jgi:ferredoxin